MKKFFFSTAIILTLTQSATFAMLDEEFTGTTLVVGGETRKDPEKLAVGLGGGDLHGNGWDSKLFENRFTKGKYSHILYEHVGLSLRESGGGDECPPTDLAKAHYDLLKPGGTFDFLSWGGIFKDNELPDGRENTLASIRFDMEERKHCFRYNDDYKKEGDPWNQWQLRLACAYDAIPRYMEDPKTVVKVINENSHVMSTVHALNSAGFKDIFVRYEQNGVLGFTWSHGSLHISAKKPE